MKSRGPIWAICLLGLVAASLAAGAAPGSSPASSTPSWVLGTHYFLIEGSRPTSLPAGKVEVTEVFSYACPACNAFQPTMHKLKESLPANAVVDYIPAGFNPGEDWPMFQLAYCTAQVLGVADKTHDAMFDAVWGSGELAVMDPASGQLKEHMPTIEDAARFYQKHAGVPPATFLGPNGAKSFAVNVKIGADEELIKRYLVDSTPTIVVNGKYRTEVRSAGGPDQLIQLVNWLVAKESR